MASRRETCSWCGVQLLVQTGAQTVQCPACRGMNRFRFINRPPSNNNYAVPGRQSYGYSQPAPPLILPSVYGKKRALLCGVSYIGSEKNIKGSVNDVRFMRDFLLENMGFPAASILILTEYENDPMRIPTKHNIRKAFKWLVQGCQPGDSLVFHFSGHASRWRDKDMDEIDGYDETLCPLDYEEEGMIGDDEINATIVRPLLRGVTLHAILDTCFSATALDLSFLCRMNKEGYYAWQDHRRPSIYKGTSGGVAICISACDDNQNCSDTTAFLGNTSTGALTYSFIQAVQNDPRLTYGRLLNAMRWIIREARNGRQLTGPNGSLLNGVIGIDVSKEPQLSSSEKFDVYSKKLVL